MSFDVNFNVIEPKQRGRIYLADPLVNGLTRHRNLLIDVEEERFDGRDEWIIVSLAGNLNHARFEQMNCKDAQ